jgi:hypothetical protein
MDLRCSRRAWIAAVLSAGATLCDAAPVRPRAVKGYGNLPLSFEVNRGQSGDDVKFLARGAGFSLFLAHREAILMFQDRSRAGHVATVKMRIAGAKTTTELQGMHDLPGRSNYFIGSNPGAWRTNIPT